MTRKSWFVAVVALLFAVSLGLAEVSFAQQGQGQGMGRRGQGGQGWGQGYGPGNANCPNYPGYRNCPRAGGNTNAQARRGRRWNQPVNPPAPQSAAPENIQ
jgi:hypothetical protein